MFLKTNDIIDFCFNFKCRQFNFENNFTKISGLIIASVKYF